MIPFDSALNIVYDLSLSSVSFDLSFSNRKDDERKDKEGSDKGQKVNKSSRRKEFKEEEKISSSDAPIGFRLGFPERYESLVDLAVREYGINESNFPHLIDEKTQKEIPHNPSPDVKKTTDLRKLESMLKELTKAYHELEESESDSFNLEKIRARIHDCKRKIHMLKNS